MKSYKFSRKQINILLFLFVFILQIRQIYAVPPPDLVIQVVSQLWIYFAMWIAIISTIFGVTYSYLKNFYYNNKILSISLLIILIISTTSLYQYLSYDEKIRNIILQNENINKWLNYKDQEIYEKYKGLSYNEKVKILLEIEEKELHKWFFDWKETNFVGKSISNENLDKIINSGNKEYVLLDARENLENELWKIPWSIHHRPADLKLEEKWKLLPTNKTYIVICWSWMRGKLVSEYLMSKWIKTMYLEWWVQDWINYWWIFVWETEIENVFSWPQYNKYITNEEFLENIKLWTKIVDAREITRLNDENKLQNSDNISTMYSSSETLIKKYNEYNKNDTVIVVCDDYVNCFDAIVVWIELERVWVKFLWVYFKKWVVK